MLKMQLLLGSIFRYSLRILLLLFVFLVLSFSTIHKYYISVTQINYIAEKQSLQITSRLFIDDFEDALQLNYGKSIILEKKRELVETDAYIRKYLKDRIKIIINNKVTSFNFIGKEYVGDIVKCYLEVEDVTYIKSLSISNCVLFDLFKDQQNIIRTKINSKNKSVIQTNDNNITLIEYK